MKTKPIHISVDELFCPACHKGRLRTYRTKHDAWGKIRYTRCTACGQPVVVTVENCYQGIANPEVTSWHNETEE